MAIVDANFSCHPMLDVRWVRQKSGVPDLPLAQCLVEQDRFGPNAIFDVQHYRAAYGSDIPQGMTCLEHFCRQAKERPRDPNGTFSVQQWHETLGWRASNPDDWRAALISSLGAEARFAFDEMERHRAGQVVVSDTVIGEGPAEGQDLSIFAHHDKNDEVQPYVLDYMDVLRAQGLCVVFLTNSAALTPSAMEGLRSRAWRLVCTRNRAYDWGLYSIGVERLKPYANHAILLTNDSVIGTLNDMGPLFRIARSGEVDVTGAVDCWLHCWHLQSFFLYASAETVGSQPWQSFWANYRPLEDKWFVINSHEFGFSRWMTRHGVRMRAGWPYGDLIAHTPGTRSTEWRIRLLENRQATNPTVHLWDMLLEQGFPFLKRTVFTQELPEHNLTNMCNVISCLAKAKPQPVERGGSRVLEQPVDEFGLG
jgi:Rhamnan synthesis protein F